MDNAKILIVKGDVDPERFRKLGIDQIQAILKKENFDIIVDSTLKVEGKYDISVNINDVFYLGIHGYNFFVENQDPVRTAKTDKNTPDSVLRREIVNLLIELGIGPNLKGFEYLLESLIIALNDTKTLKNITKYIYQVVAEEKGVSVDSVGKAIQRAISLSTARTENRIALEVLGVDVDFKKVNPSPADFIRVLTYKIKKYL